MNALLWRAELGGGRETVSEIPLENVIQRVLTCADRSTLTVQHRGQRLGQLQWVPSILEETPDYPLTGPPSPDGMVQHSSGYQIEADFSLTGAEPGNRWRVTSRIEVETNLLWRSSEVKVIQRPMLWQISAKAGEEFIRLRTEEGKKVSEQSFTRADLLQLSSFLGPLRGVLPPGIRLDEPSTSLTANPALKAHWIAGNDWLKLGRQRIRAYSVRTRLFDRFEVVVYISRAGEILKVILPDRYELTNEAVTSLDHD